jgi:hypothetical protein
MLEDELTLRAEEVAQTQRSLGTFKTVSFVNPHPGERASFGAQRISGAGELLLLGEQRFARGKPLLAGRDGVVGDRSPPL